MARSAANSGNRSAGGYTGPPPPLEGEALCLCGELEGEHRTDGTCSALGCACAFFVELDDFDEVTRPNVPTVDVIDAFAGDDTDPEKAH